MRDPATSSSGIRSSQDPLAEPTSRCPAVTLRPSNGASEPCYGLTKTGLDVNCDRDRDILLNSIEKAAGNVQCDSDLEHFLQESDSEESINELLLDGVRG